MLNQSGITKVSATTPNLILYAPEMGVSFSCKIANTGIEADANGKKIVKAGTPLYGSLTARDTAFTVSGAGTAATATATKSSTGITAVTVNATTFGTKIGGIGDRYVFSASKPSDEVIWSLDGVAVDLTDYGVSITGEADAGDTITVIYTPAVSANPVGIALHDVDVTSGTKNAQVTVFGFVDVSKLETAVATALAAATPAGITLVR